LYSKTSADINVTIIDATALITTKGIDGDLESSFSFGFAFSIKAAIAQKTAKNTTIKGRAIEASDDAGPPLAYATGTMPMLNGRKAKRTCILFIYDYLYVQRGVLTIHSPPRDI